MATDKSEPRVGLIVKIGVLSVVSLVVAHACLVAYFDDMAHSEEYRKIGGAKPVALMTMRADEMQRLSGTDMPIDKAEQMMGTRGRAGLGSDLAPKPSMDMAPLQGWIRMPSEVPPAMSAAAAEAAASGGGPSNGLAAGPDAGVDAAPAGRGRTPTDSGAPVATPPGKQHPRKVNVSAP